MALFGRQVVLQMGPPGGAGKRFEGFRIAFDIKMSTSSSPNEGKITAWNLAASSIALAQPSDAVIELYAGYGVPRLLFRGNPVADGVKLSRRGGVDTVLEIAAKDGGKVYKEARVSATFATSTTGQQAIDEILRQMGCPVGTVRVPEGLRFNKGVTFNGLAREVLDRLADSTGSEWYFRDGALQFIGRGEDTGEEAVVFSAAAGNLVGSPSPKDGGIEVTGLLAPTLRPGKPFVVESADYNGVYTATDVSFKGDSGYDRPFYTVASGTPRG